MIVILCSEKLLSVSSSNVCLGYLLLTRKETLQRHTEGSRPICHKKCAPTYKKQSWNPTERKGHLWCTEEIVCSHVCLPQTKHAATCFICQVCLPNQRVSQTAIWREQRQAVELGSDGHRKKGFPSRLPIASEGLPAASEGKHNIAWLNDVQLVFS